MECEDFASSLAEKIKRLSREGHGRDRVSLNYRSFMFRKLPPPACPDLCYECLAGTLLCQTTFAVESKLKKPFLHLSLSKAGPFTLEICVKALKCKVFQIIRCLIKPLLKNSIQTIFQGDTS